MACLVGGSWLSGWVQQGGRGAEEWWSHGARLFRDIFFYKVVLPKLSELVWKDCGDLNPSVKQDDGSI